jgi:hypothetical protein
MALFTLDEEHPLTKAGLRFVHVVEQVELGLKPGDVVFEFPTGVLSTPVWRVDDRQAHPPPADR